MALPTILLALTSLALFSPISIPPISRTLRFLFLLANVNQPKAIFYALDSMWLEFAHTKATFNFFLNENHVPTPPVYSMGLKHHL